MQHLAFRSESAAALEVDNGATVRRNHCDLREITSNALTVDIRQLERA